MSISLTKELEDFGSRKLESARYLSASEVVHTDFRLLEQQGELLELQRRELRNAVAEGAAQLDKGEGVPGKAAFDKARKNLRARRSPGK